MRFHRKCRFRAKSAQINMEAYGIFMDNEHIISNSKISAIGIFLIFSVELGKWFLTKMRHKKVGVTVHLREIWHFLAPLTPFYTFVLIRKIWCLDIKSFRLPDCYTRMVLVMFKILIYFKGERNSLSFLTDKS